MPEKMMEMFVKQRHVSLLLILFVCFGCTPASLQTDESVVVDQANDLSWVPALHAGTTTKIRFSKPITSIQFAKFGEGCESLERIEADVSLIPGDVLVQTLGHIPDLIQLNLKGTTGNDVLTLATALPKLEILNLPQSSFDDAGLALIKDHPTLKLVRIETPQVTDAGLIQIAQIPNLRYLHLIQVPITDAGLEHLYPLKNLESFYLDGGDCTEEGLSELVKALPGLHFHWNQLHLHDDPQNHSHD